MYHMNRIHESCCMFSWRNATNTGNKTVRHIFVDYRTKKKYLVGFFFDFDKDFLVEIDNETEEQIYELFGADLQQTRWDRHGIITAAEELKKEAIMQLRDRILDNASEFLFIARKINSKRFEHYSNPAHKQYSAAHQSDVFLQALECCCVQRRNVDPKLFDNCSLFLVSL